MCAADHLYYIHHPSLHHADFLQIHTTNSTVDKVHTYYIWCISTKRYSIMSVVVYAVNASTVHSMIVSPYHLAI